jgi:antiviral helicase SKI2
MDLAKQEDIIRQALKTNPDNAEKLLKELGLAGLPSRKHVHREIEAKLLSPRERLPDHWLPTYQMYEILRCLSDLTW